jgi:hypothetical protein
VSAYEETQVSMRRSHLLAARAALQTCLDEACPSVLRSDCAGWLKEVDSRTPSVVVEASQDGVPAKDLKLFVDGKEKEGGTDGKGMDLDPGTHTFRVEPQNAPPVSVEVLVREGEKLKLVRIEVHTNAGERPPPNGGGGAVEPVRPPQDSGPATRPVPWTVYAAGAVTLGAAAGFTVFALSGRSGKNDLEPCKPDCMADQISAVRQKFIIADVLLGVSVVALAATGYLFFTRPLVTSKVGRLLTTRSVEF